MQTYLSAIKFICVINYQTIFFIILVKIVCSRLSICIYSYSSSYYWTLFLTAFKDWVRILLIIVKFIEKTFRRAFVLIDVALPIISITYRYKVILVLFFFLIRILKSVQKWHGVAWFFNVRHLCVIVVSVDSPSHLSYLR